MLRSRGTGVVRVVYIFFGVRRIGLVLGGFCCSWVEVEKNIRILSEFCHTRHPFRDFASRKPTLNTGERMSNTSRTPSPKQFRLAFVLVHNNNNKAKRTRGRNPPSPNAQPTPPLAS